MTGPGTFDRPRASLDDVLCTEELRRRPSRPPDYQAENRALVALAEAMARAPRTILQELVDTARSLCRADSAGISILEPGSDPEMFRWHAIAGQFGVNAGQGMARDHSPCGTVLDHDAVLLFARPERHFAYTVPEDPPLVEALLAPFHADGKPIGTVWVLAHTESRQFDAEDARLLESLSRFAAAAYQMSGALDAAEAGQAELERRVAERTREGSDANRALRESEARLEAELSAIRRLQELSTRLVDSADLSGALESILGATIALVGADMGDVRLYDHRRRVLEMTASRGFGPDFLDRFREVDAEEDTACGRALRGDEMVVIEDVETDPDYAKFRQAAASAGYRAVVTVPLRRRGGELIGMVSAHFRGPHRPSDRDRRMLDLYGRMASAFIEHLRAEAALREGERRLRLALTAARMGIWSLDLATGIQARDVNLNQLLGLHPTDTAQRFSEFLEHVHPADRAVVEASYDATARDGRPLDLEYRVVQPDGAVRWLRDQGDVFGDPSDGRRMAGACLEVTERQKAEERVARQAAMLDGINRIFHEALSGRSEEELGRVCLAVAEDVTDSAFSFMGEINSETGRLEDLAISDRGWAAFTTDDPAFPAGHVPMGFEFHGLYGRVLIDGKGLYTNDPGSHPDSIGTPKGHAPLRAFLGVPLVRDGRTVGMIGLGNREGGYGPAELEMAEALAPAIMQALLRKRAEDELRRARDELELRVAQRTAELARANEALQEGLAARKELLRRLVTAQEDERRRISRELHDGLGQEMTALILGLKALERTVPEDAPSRDRLLEVQQIINRIGRESHDLAVELRPTALDDIGLAPALSAYITRWSERTGVAADFEPLGLEGERLPPEVETTVYRVVQEALNNVVKHAGSSHVSVIVERRGGELTALVEDNGRGFDLERVRTGSERQSLGLLGMRERVGLVDGSLVVESDEGEGTTVRARIPLNRPPGRGRS